MGYLNLGSSLRYEPSGRKRKSYYKTKSLSTNKRSSKNSTLEISDEKIEKYKRLSEHEEKYPSLMETGNMCGDTHKLDDSYKKETSKKYTVSIGYNKGGYQVIPNSEIKDIGR